MSSPSPTSPTKRLACDRCHQKKVRCTVARDQKVCTRCQRQGLSCNFSPPAKTGRPAHNKMRRNNTAPSPTTLRHKQSFSLVSSTQSLSMSPSPGTFPTVAPRTPSLDGSMHPTPLLTSPGEYPYPGFDGPMIVGPHTLVPQQFEDQFFHEHTQGLLTPSSYEGSCSPMTTASSINMPPYIPTILDHPMQYEPSAISQPLNLEVRQDLSAYQNSGTDHHLQMQGFNLSDTLNQLAELEQFLPDQAPGNQYSPDQRMETLLKAADEIHMLLAPYFDTDSSVSAAHSLAGETLEYIISVFNRVMQAFEAMVDLPAQPHPTAMRHARHLSVENASPFTRAVSPAVLSIHSPMPMHASPMLQPTQSPYHPTSTPVSHTRSGSSPLQMSVTANGASLPSPGPLRLGQEYESLDPELTKWVLANTLHWHVRNLSKLQKRMEVCLSFCATPQTEHGLGELSHRIVKVRTQLQGIINQLQLSD